MARSSADKILEETMEMLDEVYKYRETDPRRARFLRHKLYEYVLTEIARENNALSRERMHGLASTALQAEDMNIQILPSVSVRY